MDPFIGQICFFGFNFAPRGWVLCDGSTLSISQNTALFSLLGTQYGGDGVTTFKVPDLRGRAAVGQGNMPGGDSFSMGEMGGSTSRILTVAQMPAHSHVVHVPVSSGSADTNSSLNTVLASDTSGSVFTAAANADESYPGTSATPAGSSQPFDIMSPYTVGCYCIAIQGIYPPRP